MADKATTSSLLEAIKNKLNKFDSKTSINEKPQIFPSNNPTEQENKNSEKILDKTSISLNLDESFKKIDEKTSKSASTNQSPHESDLDIDDESVNVKNFSPKVSVESKIKEIADEVNLEEFENDVEDTEFSDTNQNLIDNKKPDNLSSITSDKQDEKNQDPIEIELIQLEKEIAQKKQQNKDPHNIESNQDLKNYLDSEFKKDVEDLNNQISNKNLSNNMLETINTNSVANVTNISSTTTTDSSSKSLTLNQNFNDNINSQQEQDYPKNLSQDLPDVDSIDKNLSLQTNIAPELTSSKLPNVFENKIFEGFNNNQTDSFNFLNNFSKTFSPARDYLAKISPSSNQTNSVQIDNHSNILDEKSSDKKTNQEYQNDEKIIISSASSKTINPESQDQEVVNKTETSEKSVKTQSENKLPENQNIDAKQSPLQDKNYELKTETDKNNSKSSEFIDDNYLKTQPSMPLNQDNILSSTEVVFSKNLENSYNSKIDQSPKIDSMFESKISQNSENLVNNSQSLISDNSDKININFSSSISKPNQINDLKNSLEISNLNNEANKNNFIERVNYNLIHEETIYQANNSIKKLVDAKNMIKNVNNFAHNDILNKIAISLMEPKLEKWLNENLPQLVEEIVKQEIDKIVPKE